MPGVIPSEDAFNRIGHAVRHFEKTHRNKGLVGKKRTILGGGCSSRNEVWQITIFGSPTGGTWDLNLNVLGTTETMQFNWDDTSTEVNTELETHTKIASGDVSVTGGPFPDASITIEFTGDLAKYRIPNPNWDFGSLTGGTGVGITIARYQPGHPKDGSVAP